MDLCSYLRIIFEIRQNLLVIPTFDFTTHSLFVSSKFPTTTTFSVNFTDALITPVVACTFRYSSTAVYIILSRLVRVVGHH